MFKPYPYQQECQSCIDTSIHNLVVTAPTGAGKSKVLDYAIERALREKSKVIYTSPLKALSNQKYKDLQKRYGSVGLLTGDFTFNRDASILVMTAEILRNMLLCDTSFLDGFSILVVDEFHYISDEERGSVWEESIMLLPKHIRLITLSATMQNAEELRQWIESVHNKTDLIQSTHRPVPLEPYVYNNTTLKKYCGKTVNKGSKPFDLNTFLGKLKSKDMLPCIFFMFNRTKCNDYAKEVLLDFSTAEDKHEINIALEAFSEKYPFFRHSFLRKTLMKGVGVHHAGILPQLKSLIEDLYLRGLVKVVFATETLAAGINLPAKLSVVSSLEKYDGNEKRFLTNTEFLQISGRAGRMGFDDVGYCIILTDQKYDTNTVDEYFNAIPGSIESKLKVDYSLYTNLITYFQEHDLSEVLDNSFYAYKCEVNKKNYCTKFSDNKFKKFINYSNVLGKLDTKLARGIINKKEYNKKKAQLIAKLAPYPCGSCVNKDEHVKHITNKTCDGLKDQVANIHSVLKHYKYLDSFNRLTEEGLIIKDLNFESSLFLSELIHGNIFEDLDYAQLACLLACIVVGDREYTLEYNNKKNINIKRKLSKMRKVLDEVRLIENMYNIDNKVQINPVFVEFVGEWVYGATWGDILKRGLDENLSGDFYRVLKRVIDLLKQLSKLGNYAISSDLHTNINMALTYMDRDEIATF